VDTAITVAACLAGYFVGALSFSRIFIRLFAPSADLSKVTMPVSGVTQPVPMSAISANTAGMILGPKLGGVIGILDILKAFAPTLAFRLLFPGQPYYLFTALFAVAGHDWPIYYGFKGGRGISPMLGGLLAIDWLGVVACSAGAMLIALAVLRNFGLMFPLTMFLIIPWLWFTTHDPLHLLYGVAVNVLFIIAFIPDARVILRALKEKHGPVTMREMMETNTMGRSMLSLASKLKLMK
jgi:acyl phosphate:glycerol-3-phosphate acyltransferase